MSDPTIKKEFEKTESGFNEMLMEIPEEMKPRSRMR